MARNSDNSPWFDEGEERPRARKQKMAVKAAPKQKKNFSTRGGKESSVHESPWFDKSEKRGTGKKSRVAYPQYEKMSSQAQDFRSAFRAARKSGAKTFEWEGRKYTTKVKGE